MKVRSAVDTARTDRSPVLRLLFRAAVVLGGAVTATAIGWLISSATAAADTPPVNSPSVLGVALDSVGVPARFGELPTPHRMPETPAPSAPAALHLPGTGGVTCVTGGPSVTLTGAGVVPPEVSVSVDRIDFGNIPVAQRAEKTIFVLNGTSAAVPLTPSAFTGGGPGDFSHAGGSCGSSLPAGQSCTIIVRFAPTALRVEVAVPGVALQDRKRLGRQDALVREPDVRLRVADRAHSGNHRGNRRVREAESDCRRGQVAAAEFALERTNVLDDLLLMVAAEIVFAEVARRKRRALVDFPGQRPLVERDARNHADAALPAGATSPAR